MRIGTPKEIKVHEYRVGLTPAGVRELVAHGHEVLIETGAGLGIGVADEAYRKLGARIAADADEVFASAELIVKVKEPQPVECARLRENQTLFTYLHLAPDPQQTAALLASGCNAIAYETVRDALGGLPLLAPMSEVAGRMSIQAGAHALEKAQGGIGVLLGGVPGVAPAEVLILGGGVVGYNAARIAVGMGARVTVLDRSLARLKQLDEMFEGRLVTLYSTRDAIDQMTAQADLVIGAVLVPGAAAPRLVTREHLRAMKPGAVVVDVAIDQGGCFETSRPTTHDAPTYVEEGVVHYCVANMPGAVARTSTFALTNATLPFVLALADQGVRRALLDDAHLREGLNVHAGRITYKAVAESLGQAYTPASEALKPWWAHPDAHRTSQESTMADYSELKKKQRATWALGEYDRIADGLLASTDQTLRVARVKPGERVLDLATGTGITAIAARERGAQVTGLDLTPELLEVARGKAGEAGYSDIDFREGDAENMPFADASFDVVLSTCGHMFAPDQEKVASELARVTRPGGRVVFLAWTPEGGLGNWFRITNQHVAPPPGVASPFNWGNADKVRALLGTAFSDVSFTRGDCTQHGDSPDDIWQLFSTRYGPTIRAVAALQGAALDAFRNEMLAFLAGYRAADGKVRWGREYLITRAIRAG